MNKALLGFSGWLLILADTGEVGGAQYTVRDLGPVGGDNIYSYGAWLGLNNSGTVVGTTGVESELPFVLRQNTRTWLDTLDATQTSLARAVNESGGVAGWSWAPNSVGSSAHAVYWDSEGLHDIGEFGFAYDLNNSGTVVGELLGRPFVWNESTGLQRLDGLGTGAAIGINQHGDAVGEWTIDGTAHAFFWSSLGGVTDLGLGVAMAVNDSGDVITTEGAHLMRIWNVNGTSEAIPALIGSSNDNMAFDINNRRQVVGYADINPSAGFQDSRAFLYSGGITVDLNSLLGPADSEWTLSYATSINDRGEIVGVGYNTALYGGRGFLLTTVPDAGSTGYFLTTVIMVLFASRLRPRKNPRASHF